MNDLLTELRRPFPAEAVGFKVQANPKSDTGNALIVAFVDARAVTERLNEVVGLDWEDAYRHEGGGIVCSLTVKGVTREDVGYGEGTDEMGVKGAYSDALKRAAVRFGIGSSLYALDRCFVPAKDLKQLGRTWVIPRATEAKLRDGYEEQLERMGFGEPFDTPHGAPLVSDESPRTAADPEDVETVKLLAARARDERGWTGEKFRSVLPGEGTIPERVDALTPEQAHEVIATLTLVVEMGGDLEEAA